MKRILAVMAASVLALGACVSESEAPEPTAVDQFIGKRLVAENGTIFLFNADGTVGGMIRGEEIVGAYTADAREICSTYTAPEFLAGQEYCSVPSVNGDMVVFNRRDGSRSQAYKIGG